MLPLEGWMKTAGHILAAFILIMVLFNSIFLDATAIESVIRWIAAFSIYIFLALDEIYVAIKEQR